jgi:hypothetical protein
MRHVASATNALRTMWTRMHGIHWSRLMILTTKRRVILAVLTLTAVFVGIVVWRSAWNYAGYCHIQGRVLPEEERVRIAIEDVLQTYPPPVRTPPESRNMERPTRPIPYAGVEAFRTSNPDCCEVVDELPEGYSPPLSARMRGQFSSFVRLKFRVRYLTNTGVEAEQLVERHVAISNCGRPWSGF